MLTETGLICYRKSYNDDLKRHGNFLDTATAWLRSGTAKGRCFAEFLLDHMHEGYIWDIAPTTTLIESWFKVKHDLTGDGLLLPYIYIKGEPKDDFALCWGTALYGELRKDPSLQIDVNDLDYDELSSLFAYYSNVGLYFDNDLSLREVLDKIKNGGISASRGLYDKSSCIDEWYREVGGREEALQEVFYDDEDFDPSDEGYDDLYYEYMMTDSDEPRVMDEVFGLVEVQY